MQTLSIPIDYVTVVSASRDSVYLHVSDGAPGLDELHAGYDEWNGRTVKISTIAGNGEALARLLGWSGPVEVVHVARIAKENLARPI